MAQQRKEPRKAKDGAVGGGGSKKHVRTLEKKCKKLYHAIALDQGTI